MNSKVFANSSLCGRQPWLSCSSLGTTMHILLAGALSSQLEEGFLRH